MNDDENLNNDDIEEEEMIPLSAVKDMIQQQVDAMFQSKISQQEAEEHARISEELARRSEYVAIMKQSPEPWVDIKGENPNQDGVEMELDWNDAFITYLREANIPGATEDEVVRKWLELLMHDIAGENKEEEFG